MSKTARWVLFMALFLTLFLVRTPIACASTSGALEEIMEYVHELHISSPQEEALYDGAIHGLIDTLDDPYTVYMNPDEVEEFINSLQGTFVGVGVELVPGNGYPGILRTIEDSPAENAGIQAGDIIIRVDGNDIAKDSLPDIVEKIRGPEGTIVRLTIQRVDMGEFDVELIRTSIDLPYVQEELLEDGTGYIKIDMFGSSTADDFEESLTRLKELGAEKLILDLRGNPGGYLNAAVQIAGNFIEKDRLVVSIVDNNNERQDYYTEDNMLAKDMPVAVLINEASASASEILAGALQDYGIAALIGDRTYGKGSVQTIIALKAGGALKLTTARYHTPHGRAIDHLGIAPDIQVLTPELQLGTALDWLNPREKKSLTFKEGGTGAIVNGRTVELSQAPLQQGDSIYLPLRVTLEALGYRVDWQFSDGGVKVTGNKSEVLFYPGEDRLALSGGQVVMGIDPLIYKNGVTYLPLSSLKFFNLKVNFENGQIAIEK